MPLKAALKEQVHAAIAMLVDCVEKCPEDLWVSPSRKDVEPDDPRHFCIRNFWRIAFHGIYFTHLYMLQSVELFQRPKGLAVGDRDEFAPLWNLDRDPFDLPEECEPPTRQEMLDYIAHVDALVDPTVDGLDLESPESGVPWYKNFPKLNHELLTLRHLQGHVGQLSELLMARQIDTNWVSRVKKP
ncbi:MAG: hypothetical protein M9921_01250 [Fimbriimonadaceae bacterium]|nr:hypothetical protein [Fimbriimonadaceae bacterium]